MQWTLLMVGGGLVGLGVLCTAAGRLLRRSGQAKGPKIKAMKQFARDITSNPGYADWLGSRLRSRSDHIDAARSGPPPTVDEIPHLARQLLDDNGDVHDPAEIRLRKAGGAAAPAVLALLDDPKVAASVQTMDKDDNGESPFVRVADLLWSLKCRELGVKIGHLADHPNWRIYNLAIKSRAALGRASDAAWMLGILNDATQDNAHMRREKLCEGTDLAIAEGRAEPALGRTLLDWARENVLPSTPQSAATHPLKWSIDLLLTSNRDSTLALLLSDRVLSLDNTRNIHFVLDALTREGVTLPEAVVRPMLDKAMASERAGKERSKELWPWNCTFGSALNALASTSPRDAIDLAESVLEEECFAFDANRFLYRALGLPKVWQIQPPESFPLSSEERSVVDHLSNVIGAEGQIENGGLSQYFFNSSGDHWRRDVTSFLFIGAKDCADAIEQAAFILGKSDGTIASVSRDRRMKQYADLPEDQEAQLDTLSRVIWDKRLDARVYRFLLQHADLFRRIKAARLAAGIDGPGED